MATVAAVGIHGFRLFDSCMKCLLQLMTLMACHAQRHQWPSILTFALLLHRRIPARWRCAVSAAFVRFCAQAIQLTLFCVVRFLLFVAVVFLADAASLLASLSERRVVFFVCGARPCSLRTLYLCLCVSRCAHIHGPLHPPPLLLPPSVCLAFEAFEASEAPSHTCVKTHTSLHYRTGQRTVGGGGGRNGETTIIARGSLHKMVRESQS